MPKRAGRARVLLAAALAWLFAVTLGRAAAAESRKLSPYEAETLGLALEKVGGELDAAAEGKRVETIVVVPLPVIEPRDPLPGFLNWFHVTTRRHVLAREVLMRPGARYEEALAAETERNLRGWRQLSVVLVVPLRGSAADRVKVLVVTKDVWTLRVNWQPVVYNGRLQYLALQPAEENLLGRRKTGSATVVLTRSTYTLGLGYLDPRIAGSRLQAEVSAGVIYNCQSQRREGSFGTLSYGKPQYFTRSPWSWMTTVLWDHRVVRPISGANTSICGGGEAARLDARATPQIDRMPAEYEQDILAGQVYVRRSYGRFRKTDLSWGLETNRRGYSTERLSAYDPRARAEFERLIVPTNQQRISPFFELRAYSARFLRLLEGETLGFQEDLRLGHDATLRVYPALRAVGSTRDMLGVFNGAAYTLPVADGYARAVAESRIELSSLDNTQAESTGSLRLVTPRSGIGRLVSDTSVVRRYFNRLNTTSQLGGAGRLRGYAQSAFIGPDMVVSNLEFRSRALQVSALQLGGVLFYDVGDAGRGLSRLALRHGAGAGLRLVIPYFERAVFRVDVGFPLQHDPKGEVSVTAAFYQAFGFPAVTPPSYTQ